MRRLNGSEPRKKLWSHVDMPGLVLPHEPDKKTLQLLKMAYRAGDRQRCKNLKQAFEPILEDVM